MRWKSSYWAWGGVQDPEAVDSTQAMNTSTSSASDSKDNKLVIGLTPLAGYSILALGTVVLTLGIISIVKHSKK